MKPSKFSSTVKYEIGDVIDILYYGKPNKGEVLDCVENDFGLWDVTVKVYLH